MRNTWSDAIRNCIHDIYGWGPRFWSVGFPIPDSPFGVPQGHPQPPGSIKVVHMWAFSAQFLKSAADHVNSYQEAPGWGGCTAQECKCASVFHFLFLLVLSAFTSTWPSFLIAFCPLQTHPHVSCYTLFFYCLLFLPSSPTVSRSTGKVISEEDQVEM